MKCVCIASGPSITTEQIRLVKKHKSDLFVICVNDAYRLIAGYDAVFAADRQWWKEHYDKVETNCKKAKLYTLEGHNPYKDRLISIKHTKQVDLHDNVTAFHGSNSGQIAIHLAILLGFKDIILIGYDFKKSDDGKVHFFGDHPQHLKNATNIEQWLHNIDIFMSNHGHKANIVNCSNDTSINSIRRSNLEIALCC
jgi:hypothetical protein